MRIQKRCSTRVICAILFVCICFVSGCGYMQSNETRSATTTDCLANYDFNQMVELSDLIIGGKVYSISDPFWDKENASIVRREAIVKVTEVFDSSGEISYSVKILLTGGTIGDYTHDVEPSVDLNIGDDMILFLKKTRHGEHYVILNSTQGALYANPMIYTGNHVRESDVVYSTAENNDFYFYTTTKNELAQKIAEIKGT